METASSLLRKNGLNGVGIYELMAEAGLTRGGFYRMFGSKERLAGEACALAFDEADEALSRAGKGEPEGRLQRLVEFYFAPKPPGHDCPMATMGSDVARTPEGSPVCRAFTKGLREAVEVIAGEKPDDQAMILMAAMVVRSS